jgi:hypothetical protein
MTALLATSFGAARWLPGVSEVIHSTGYPEAQRLVMIQDESRLGDSVPSISPEQYRVWTTRRQGIFDDFAFYQVRPELVSSEAHSATNKRIAVASRNLFSLLDLPVRYAAIDLEIPRTMPKLILSEKLWRQQFGADPEISGHVVRVGSMDAVVEGIVAPGEWKLPGKVDAWLLQPDGEAGANGVGFVVARLKPSGVHSTWANSWHMSAPRPDGTTSDFTCVSLVERTRGPSGIFLFAVFLACLALPATTSLPLGEYRRSSRKLSWATSVYRWTFLGCKLALLLPIVYCISLDLAYSRATFAPASSQYIQLVAAFSVCLFGLRWTIRDQRQRCPVCLRKLTNPARVGEPSRNFLAWNGTELICVGGHGLLHVPEISTSWFSTQRWLYLDPSWEVLFAESGMTSASYF